MDRPETRPSVGGEVRAVSSECFERFYGDVVRYARRRVDPEVAGDVAAEVPPPRPLVPTLNLRQSRNESSTSRYNGRIPRNCGGFSKWALLGLNQ
jgi:hypothetical protein